MTTLIQLVLAMARSQQGQETTAREHLARAAKLLDLYLSDADRFPTEGDCDYFHDWLIAWLLHREARSLIEAKTRQSAQ
jgi:hypothetical protein